MIPVCFVYDGGCIYSVLDAKPKRTSLTGLRRVRNILANPQVSLVLDHYDDDWAQLWYLLVTGRAELIEGTDESERAIASLREKISSVSLDGIDWQSSDQDYAGTGSQLVW